MNTFDPFLRVPVKVIVEVEGGDDEDFVRGVRDYTFNYNKRM